MMGQKRWTPSASKRNKADIKEPLDVVQLPKQFGKKNGGNRQSHQQERSVLEKLMAYCK